MRGADLITLIEGEKVAAARLFDLFSDYSIVPELLELGALVPDGQGRYRVQFVGVGVARGKSVQFLPKFYEPRYHEQPVLMRHVVRALRRYGRRPLKHVAPEPFLRAATASAAWSHVAISDWLIRDYLEYGVYRRARKMELVGTGFPTIWAKTIDRMLPVHSKSGPVYAETVFGASDHDLSLEISRLHVRILEEVAAEYAHLLGYGHFDLDHEPFERLRDVPSAAYAQALIANESRLAFSDRALGLLSMIRAWLLGRDARVSGKLSLYGTSQFYGVWEDVCSSLFGNEVERWLHHIPRPAWTSAGGDRQEGPTFRPDVITRFQHEDGEHLVLVDAKYYRLTMPPGLAGFPGVNDVAKQLWYELCLLGPAKAAGFKAIHNGFVFPGSGSGCLVWSDGQASLPGVAGSVVQVKRLDGLTALMKYGDGSVLEESIVRTLMAAADH